MHVILYFGLKLVHNHVWVLCMPKIYHIQKYPLPPRIGGWRGARVCWMCQGSRRIWELFLCTVISRFGFYSLFILWLLQCLLHQLWLQATKPRLKLQWYNYFLQFVCFSASNYSWVWRCQRTRTVVTINHKLYHALRDRFGSFWFTISGLKTVPCGLYCTVYCHRGQFYTFFGISIGIEWRMIDMGKK